MAKKKRTNPTKSRKTKSGKTKPKSASKSANSSGSKNNSDIFKILFFTLLSSVLTAAGIWVYYNREQFSQIDNIKGIFAGSSKVKEKEGKNYLCLENDLPNYLLDDLESWAAASTKDILEIKEFNDEPPEDCKGLVASSNFGGYDLAWKKYYAAVVDRTTPIEDITFQEFQQMIGGNPIKNSGREYQVVVSNYAKDFVEDSFGVGVTVSVVDDVESKLQEDGFVGVVPFEDVSYKTRVIKIDGISLLDSGNSQADTLENYPLAEGIWVQESENMGLFSVVRNSMGSINFNPENITTVVVSGTSVMGGRGLYQKIQETGDPIYPIREIAPVLQEADIAHISNEASFAEDCVQYKGTVTFCGGDDSFEAFTYAGVDVVGLTGNHILDAGEEYFLQTLKMYEDAGIKYFGGGRDENEARSPAIVEINGITFAFLGYNAIPPATYFAGPNSPGSAEMTKSSMSEDIKEAKSQADYVFVDMQWGPEYQHFPIAYQEEFGHAAVEAGADFITGVHPHWVQPVEYYRDGLIFYSLGNLLFDQMWSQKTREGVMIKHIFYNEDYMGFEVIPTMIYEGAQPRLVEGEDADRIRNYVYGVF